MSGTKPEFNFEEAPSALNVAGSAQQEWHINTTDQPALAAELEQPIESGDVSNRKDGSTSKTVKSVTGYFSAEYAERPQENPGVVFVGIRKRPIPTGCIEKSE